MNELQWLQRWYELQCDGSWEHQYGISIRTLDNPGWAVVIDLEGTSMFGIAFDSYEKEQDDVDWVHCRVHENRFHGFGSINHLITILTLFRSWVEIHSH